MHVCRPTHSPHSEGMGTDATWWITGLSELREIMLYRPRTESPSEDSLSTSSLVISLSPPKHKYIKWKWHDMTHTRNPCSAFNPSKMHTHSSEHTHTHHEQTPRAVDRHLCFGSRGAAGLVPCSRAPRRGFEDGESAVHSLPPQAPPTVSAENETRTHNLWFTSLIL